MLDDPEVSPKCESGQMVWNLGDGAVFVPDRVVHGAGEDRAGGEAEAFDLAFDLDLDDADPIQGDAHQSSLSFQWLTDSFADPPTEPDVLIDGLIRRGELMAMGGQRALGKSWFAMQLAGDLARGTGQFLGLDIKRQPKVLLWHGELDPWMAHSRWQMYGDEARTGLAESFDDRLGVRVTQRKVGGLHDSVLFRDARIEGGLEDAIVEHGFEVAIIDPWAVFHFGDENSNDGVQAALSKVRELSLRHGTAFVIVHHFGKPTSGARGEPEDLWRGASRLPDFASTRVTMQPHYRGRLNPPAGMSRDEARRFVDLDFLRRAEPTDGFSIVRDPVTNRFDVWDVPGAATRAGSQAMSPTDVAAACASADGWDSMKKAADDLGIAEGTARNRLDEAVEARLIEEFSGPRGARGFRVVDSGRSDP